MIDSGKIDQQEVLDQETLELLGGAIASKNSAAMNLAPLRERIMQQLDDESGPGDVPIALAQYLTIRADEGSWQEIAARVEKKALNVNRKTGTESYLLRLQPGATLPEHHHDADEVCIVLEGDVSFDDVHLHAGDYHFARKGSSHGVATTSHGALIFLQSGLAAA